MEGRSILSMITMVAHVSSEEQLAESLEKYLEEYKLNPNEKTFRSLSVPCHLILTKVMNGKEDLQNIIRHQEKLLDTADIVNKMMNPDKQ